MNQFPEVICKLNFTLNQGGQFTAVADDTPELRQWLGKGNMGETAIHTPLGSYDITWGKIGKYPEYQGQISLTLISHILDDLEDYHQE
jgi:hypothetical protein